MLPPCLKINLSKTVARFFVYTPLNKGIFYGVEPKLFLHANG
jgi:hypothetical protein